MKKYVLLITTLFFITVFGIKAQSIQPFYRVATFDQSLSAVQDQVSPLLTQAGFTILGTYHPGNKENILVVAFTSKSLQDLSLQFSDRGALASVLKASIIEQGGKSTLSILNPEYMFLAYWGKQLDGQENELTKLSEQVKSLFSSLGNLVAFGGEMDKDDLPGYHYKIMMPYFDDPDELAEFDSFEDGLRVIRANLAAKKGNTLKVYEEVFAGKKIAVFGVGLMDNEIGEAHFLPIIGESHVAAMPYQIILQGKQATALPGKYRLALYWPELSMGTFMKIMRTPGDIENTLEGICE
jgi:hypothetical protein